MSGNGFNSSETKGSSCGMAEGFIGCERKNQRKGQGGKRKKVLYKSYDVRFLDSVS